MQTVATTNTKEGKDFCIQSHVPCACGRIASSPVPHKRGPGIHWLRMRQKCVGIARKLHGHDKVLITGVASEYSWKSTRDVEMENSRISRFTAMPTTVLCRLCSCTAGQQFTELYYYVIRSTDVYGRYPISPENLGNLSMRSQCIPGPLLWGTGDEASGRTKSQAFGSDKKYVFKNTAIYCLTTRKLPQKSSTTWSWNCMYSSKVYKSQVTL